MIRGDAASRNKQVVGILRDQRAIGNGIVFTLGEFVNVCTCSLGIVDVDIVFASGNGVLKFCKGNTILLGQHVVAHDHTAFAHADLGGGHHQEAVFKSVCVLFEEFVDLKHLTARK